MQKFEKKDWKELCRLSLKLGKNQAKYREFRKEKLQTRFSCLLAGAADGEIKLLNYSLLFHKIREHRGFTGIKADKLREMRRDLDYSSQLLLQAISALNDWEQEIRVIDLDKRFNSGFSLKTFLGDIKALGREGFEVRWSLKKNHLEFVTEPITLEGVYLGPFIIQISCELQAPGSSAYNETEGLRVKIFAEDTTTHAVGGDLNCHPHVQGTLLCAGTMGAAITQAGNSFRIYDLVMVVRTVLKNYNPGSPHRKLESWFDDRGEDDEDYRSCSNCDDRFHYDDVGFCEACQEYFCDTCGNTTDCMPCGRDICDNCRTSCDECGEAICQNCRQNIAVVTRQFLTPPAMSQELLERRFARDGGYNLTALSTFVCDLCRKEANERAATEEVNSVS